MRDGASKTYALMLKSRLVGENPCNIDKIFRKIKQFGGPARQGGGVCGIELALWDLAGKAYGTPVYAMLGGKLYGVPWYVDTRLLFFRTDLAANQALLERAVDVELSCGDVLFFHCRLLHAAGRNLSSQVKRSLVFTYNRQDNPPLAGSRSARMAQIPL